MKTFKHLLEQITEDQYTADYKIKYYVDPITGENKQRKIRPHRVNFKNSKMRGEPAQQDAQGDYGMKEGYLPQMTEGKMSQIHADIGDHLDKHLANYKKMGGSEHLGGKTVEAAKKIAKTHGIATVHAQKFVNDYVDNALKESDESWAAAMEKQKKDRLTDKDKETLGKIHDLMAREKAKREFDLKMKKAQNSQRVAKALGEETELDEEAAAGLAAKAKKSGVSLSTLRTVYKRGVAAWNSGHRPGTTPQQWGMARVNSYITKGKGTYHGADKDLREEDSRLNKSGYHKGLSDSTAKARVAHWKKMDKLSDRDPKAYEPAPGDKTAKTTPSVHTKKYHAMYGEEKKEDLPFTPDKPHKPVAKAGKYGQGYSTARHLARQAMKKMAKEDINEAHEVHVSDGSKYDEEPHKDDVKHINDGLKKHGGEFSGHSDKGAFFKFKSHSDAENFRRHVNSCPKRTCSADHLDESVNEAVDKEHPIYKEYQALRKMPIKDLRDRIKQQHRIVDTSEFRTKEHAASHIINNKHGNKRVKAVFGEETELDEGMRGLGPTDQATGISTHGRHEYDVEHYKDGKITHKTKVVSHHPPTWISKIAKSIDKKPGMSYKIVHDESGKVYNVKEEVEQIDELSLSTLKSAEKKNTDKAYDYHMDDNKHWARKSAMRALNLRAKIAKKERQQTKEEVEQIDELSKHKLVSYIDKAADDVGKHGMEAGKASGKGDSAKFSKPYLKAGKRAAGITRAAVKLARKKTWEEVEQIDELSKDTLNSYVHKAFAQGNDLHYDLAHSRGDKATEAERAALKAKISKRNTGIIKAAKKLREDDKVYDEKWKKYVGKSFKKATE